MTDRKSWIPAKSVSVGDFSPETVRELHRLGIREIELSSSDFEPFYAIDFLRKAKEIVKSAAELGVKITSVHLPFYPFDRIDPTDSDPTHRKYALERQCELIRAAGEAGIPISVIHPSGEPILEEERGRRLETGVSFFTELCAFAEACGVTIAAENLPRTCIGRTSDELLFLLDRVPALRACFDTNHSLTEDNCRFIRALGSKIVTLHVSDYDFINERHLLPGEGSNDWERLIGELERCDYGGRFLYEVLRRYSPEDVAANYAKLFR